MSTLTTFLSPLKSRQLVVEGTMSFRFEKPSGWMFKAGQFLDITLQDPPETDAEGNTRTFSIASAPHEENIMVATRMRDTAFKRSLKSMPLGTSVKMEGPSGDLTLQDDAARPAVLLAGGIGITPFRSMVLWAAKERLPHRIFLFYSNWRPEDAPFLEELQSLEKENPNYTLIAMMTDMKKSHRPWQGETRVIDMEMLSKYLKSFPPPIYYIAGPPGMVKGVHQTLNQAGVNQTDIHAEEFAGY
jgi:ferredoxin-NADP reductase